MTSITTNVRENVMLFDFILPTGQKVYLIQAKKISFVETSKNAEYFIWGARNTIRFFIPIFHTVQLSMFN